MEEEEKRRRREAEALGAIAAEDAVNASVRRMSEKYKKPEHYTGNRKLFDAGGAKRRTKETDFSSGKPVKDSYTGKELRLRKQEAKLTYGKNWQEHMAEADHIHPLSRVVEEHKKDAFATVDNIKDAANSPANLKTTSRKWNNAKRDRTNEELCEDDTYLKNKDLTLSKKAKERAIADGRKAKADVDRELQWTSLKNAAGEFHQAGMETAKGAALYAGSASLAMNAVAVIRGEKTPEEAIQVVAKETVTGVAVSYFAGGSVSVISHTLSTSSNPLFHILAKAGVPGKVVNAVLATFGSTKAYLEGNITGQEYIAQLGETGIATYTAGIGMYVGAIAIPIPVVGSLIGGMVGYALSGKVFTALSSTLSSAKLAREERIRIERECEEAIQQIRTYRQQLDEIAEQYFKENKKIFKEALGDMESGLQLGDADGYIHGANTIIRQLDGQVSFQNMDEFDDLMQRDHTIKL